MNLNKFDFNRLMLLSMLAAAEKAKGDEQAHDAIVLIGKAAAQPQNMASILGLETHPGDNQVNSSPPSSVPHLADSSKVPSKEQR